MSVPEPATLAAPIRLGDKIGKICAALVKLDPGPLAELRRMDTAGNDYGAPYFWRLLARPELDLGGKELEWAQVIQILAILTPKGRDDGKMSRHALTERKPKEDPEAPGGAASDVGLARGKRRGLGHVLCDGGDRAWPEDRTNPRPVYSESRLAQLLGSSGASRVDLVRRAARLLAARLPADAAFDCTDLARLLLYPDDLEAGRRIARDYYARLDRATNRDANDNADTPTGDDA